MDKQTEMKDPWQVVQEPRGTKIPRIYTVLAAISAISMAVIVYASYSVL